MRSGTHSCFIGKETACHTITHSHTDRHTGCGTCQCPGTERSHKNGGNRRRKIADIHDQYDQCSAKIQSCHDRNHFFCKGSDTGNTAKENEGCQQSHYQSHRPSGDRKSRIEGIADRVGLYHISHEAKSKNDCHCKENSQETTKAAFKHMCDIIDRSAHYFSILISLFGFLSENGFTVDRRHSKKGSQPHPEDCSQAAGHQGRRTARDISGSHLGCNRCGQSLERTHTVFSRFLSL